MGVAVRFFGAVSRDGVFPTEGVILMGFFADFGGLLEWRLDQDKSLGYALDLQRENGVVNGIFEHIII